jgi:hypothetical protein
MPVCMVWMIVVEGEQLITNCMRKPLRVCCCPTLQLTCFKQLTCNNFATLRWTYDHCLMLLSSQKNHAIVLRLQMAHQVDMSMVRWRVLVNIVWLCVVIARKCDIDCTSMPHFQFVSMANSSGHAHYEVIHAIIN